MEDITMADIFAKFEEIWAVIWEYIYAVLDYFDVEPFEGEVEA